MKTTFSAYFLAALAGAASILTPGISSAGNVGYYGDNCYNANPTTIITAAGHTPVAVATLDSAGLAGLQALFINGCTFATNAAVNTAVTNGMVLIWHDPNWGDESTKSLPGGQSVPYTVYGGNSYQIDFPAGSPVTTGPGGTINNTSLDNGNSSNHGYVASTALPVGSQVLATQDVAANVTTFAYSTGAGKVIFSTIPLTCYFPSGGCSGNVATPGMQAYAKNLIAWAVDSFTTCAAEGFTGIKLTLCRQICELPQSPATLAALIKTYMAAFRQEPPCAR